jgi:hypothetical protein
MSLIEQPSLMCARATISIACFIRDIRAIGSDPRSKLTDLK